MADTPPRHADPRLAHALELLAEAEKQTVPGDAAALGRATANAEGAIEVIAAFVAATPTPEARNMLAAAWARRGLALLVFGSEKAVPESVRSFDESIRLRRELLVSKHPALIQAQAATLVHRGDALARLGGAENLRQAAGSYDEALALLRLLPWREVPQLLARLAHVLGSRAGVLEALRTPESLTQALQAHREVIDAITGTAFEQQPEFRLYLGAAHTNLANLLLQAAVPQRDAEGARAAAVAAIASVAGLDREHPVAAEIAVKARRGVCRAIAALIEARAPVAPTPREYLHAVTDAADEALALVRHWEAKGARQFRSLAVELFGFGANVYLRHQTHFFAEYVLDNLDPERTPDAFRDCPQMHGLAASLVDDALRHLERNRIVTADTADVDRQIETMQALRHLRDRLAALAGGA